MKLLPRVLFLLLACLCLCLPGRAMAYTCTITTQETVFGADGHKYMHVVLSETAARDTSQCTITGLPLVGTVVSYRADRTAGTGTTVHPIVGLTNGFTASSINQLWLSPTTADFVTFASTDLFMYTSTSTTTATLYLLSQPNSTATDHAISTDIVIRYGGA